MRTPSLRGRRGAARLFPPALLLAAVMPAAAQSTATVVITANRYAKPVVDAPAALTVVTRRDIEARGADNVLEALRGEVGISMQGRTIAGRKSFGVRGNDGKHTLFLVDGKRIAASEGVIGHSDFQFDWIPVADIERIEIIRGPMSVLYGSEALGGVVNIITRQAGKDWRTSFHGQLGVADDGRGGDSERASVHLAGPLAEGLSLTASAAHSHQSALVKPEDRRQSEIEGSRRSDLSLGLGWRPASGHRIEADWRQGDEFRDGVGRETRGAKRYYDNLTTLSRQQLSLGWTADWAGAAHLQTQLRAYGTRLRMDNQRNNGVAALNPEQLDDRIVEGQATFEAGHQHQLVAGFEHRDETLRITGLAGGRGSVNHRSLFVQDEWRLTKALGLTAGLRMDRHEIFGTEWSPRLYAVWHPAASWTVKGGYTHGFRAPSLKQISPGAAEDQGPFTYFGNPDLRPESSDSVELGVGRETRSHSWQLMAFRNRVRDLIVQDRSLGVIAGKPSFIYDNRDRATLQGVELSTRWAVGAGFGLGGNYQFLQAEDDQGQPLEKRPRHSLGLRADWQGGPWRVGADLAYHADQWLKLATGTGLAAAPSITRLGLWATYALGGGYQLSAGIDNLTDERLADKSALFTYAELPRTMRIALRGQF